MAGHTIQVSVLADTKPLAQAMGDLGNSLGLDKLGGALKTLGASVVGAGAAAGAAVAGIAVPAVAMASDLEQSMGAVDAIFKDAAGEVKQYADAAATSAGLTKTEYAELATTLGTQLKNGGTALEELAPKTDKLISLGGDLAATFGGSSKDAVDALSAALRGERDSIEKYGVSITEAQVKTKAMELGLGSAKGELDANAKQAATLALIYDQTADAQGAFAREGDTLAGKQARLQAQLSNIGAELGTALMPAVITVVDALATNFMPLVEQAADWLAANLAPAIQVVADWLAANLAPAIQVAGEWVSTTLLPAIQSLAEWVGGTLMPALAQFGQWLIDLSPALIPIAGGIAGIVLALQAWKAVTSAIAVAQALLNAVMAANPLGAIIAIIGLVVGALVTLWMTNEDFRRKVIEIWNACVKAIGDACKAIGEWLAGVVRAVGDWFAGVGRGFKQAIDAAANLARSIGDKIGEVVRFFTDLPGKILNALSGIGQRMGEIGRNMISSLANALSPGAIVNKIRSVIGDVIGFAKRLLGIASPSKVFRGFGQFISEGLALGINDEARRAIQAVGTMGSALIDAVPGQLPVPRVPAAVGGAGTGSPSVIVNMQSLTPDAAAGRAIAAAVAEVTDRRGGRW